MMGVKHALVCVCVCVWRQLGKCEFHHNSIRVFFRISKAIRKLSKSFANKALIHMSSLAVTTIAVNPANKPIYSSAVGRFMMLIRGRVYSTCALNKMSCKYL